MCLYLWSYCHLLRIPISVQFALLSWVSRFLIVVVHFWLSSCFLVTVQGRTFICASCKTKLSFSFFSGVAALTFTCHVNGEVISFSVLSFVVNMLYFDFVVAVMFEGKSKLVEHYFVGFKDQAFHSSSPSNDAVCIQSGCCAVSW